MRNWADRKGGLKPQPDDLDRSDPGTLASRADQYFTRLTERNYSPETVKSRRWALRLFIRWSEAAGVRRPEDVTASHVDAYRSALAHFRKANGAPLTATTQRLRLDGVIGLFRSLRKTGQVAVDPTEDLLLPLERGLRLPRVLSMRHIQAVLRLPDVTDVLGLRDRAMLEVLYATAIRRAELAALDIADLDLDAGVVLVRQGKGRRDRLLPLGARAAEWVRRYLEDARPMLAGERAGDALFLSGYGERLSPRFLGQWVRKLFDQVGIHHPGACHLFRHSCATHMLERGADCRHIQQLLGHARLDTTQIYMHVTTVQLREVHARTHPHGRPDPADLPPPRRVEPAVPHPVASPADLPAAPIPEAHLSPGEPAPELPPSAASLTDAQPAAVVVPVPGVADPEPVDSTSVSAVSGEEVAKVANPAASETLLSFGEPVLHCLPCLERARPCERGDASAAPPPLPPAAPPPLEWAEIAG